MLKKKIFILFTLICLGLLSLHLTESSSLDHASDCQVCSVLESTNHSPQNTYLNLKVDFVKQLNGQNTQNYIPHILSDGNPLRGPPQKT